MNRKVVAALIAVFMVGACHQRRAEVRKPEGHLAELSRPGWDLYIDRVDNRMLLQQGLDTAGHFCCYRVGWVDSLAGTDTRQRMETERYYQYGVQNDWTALVGGDSLRPVFFQLNPSLDSRRRDGIIVFETPSGRTPDALIYRDSYGSWGNQLFVFNRKSL